MIDKSVFIRGDRGVGSGAEINAPMNAPCLRFEPKQGAAQAVIANVSFNAKINSHAACVDIGSGVFTLKESDVFGSGVRPAVRIAGGTVMLERNRIGAGSEGVIVEQAHTLSESFIIDNKIISNKVGIDVAAGSRADVVVAGNEILNNRDTGLNVAGYGAIKIFGNIIRENRGAGVVLDKYSKLSHLRLNEIAGNDGDGVAIPFGGNVIVENNLIVGNGGMPIFIGESKADTVRVLNNEIVPAREK